MSVEAVPYTILDRVRAISSRVMPLRSHIPRKMLLGMLKRLVGLSNSYNRNEGGLESCGEWQYAYYNLSRVQDEDAIIGNNRAESVYKIVRVMRNIIQGGTHELCKGVSCVGTAFGWYAESSHQFLGPQMR